MQKIRLELNIGLWLQIQACKIYKSLWHLNYYRIMLFPEFIQCTINGMCLLQKTTIKTVTPKILIWRKDTCPRCARRRIYFKVGNSGRPFNLLLFFQWVPCKTSCRMDIACMCIKARGSGFVVNNWRMKSSDILKYHESL